MYVCENKVHTSLDRIVSISQPYIHSIVRESENIDSVFSAKLDRSIDENGVAKLEKLSFCAYNLVEVLITAIESYQSRTEH